MNKPLLGPLRDESAGMTLAIRDSTELTRDAGKARVWYLGERIAVYGNRTADELIRDGHIDAVLAYLQDLRNGTRG